MADVDILAELLEVAISDPSRRPDFYNMLLASEVYVLGSCGDTSVHGVKTLQKGEGLTIKNWVRPDGSPVIPFFSSVNAILKAVENNEEYIILPARALFEITRGADLCLNPRSPSGKEFLSKEIEALLDVTKPTP